MYELRYLAQAKDDLKAIKEYLAKESGSQKVALQYVARLREQCRKLSQIAGKIGRARPEIGEQLRSFPYGNYVIFFMYNGDALDVVSIIEGHRDINVLHLNGH